jgi:predicted S18 family serine protease
VLGNQEMQKQQDLQQCGRIYTAMQGAFQARILFTPLESKEELLPNDSRMAAATQLGLV